MNRLHEWTTPITTNVYFVLHVSGDIKLKSKETSLQIHSHLKPRPPTRTECIFGFSYRSDMHRRALLLTWQAPDGSCESLKGVRHKINVELLQSNLLRKGGTFRTILVWAMRRLVQAYQTFALTNPVNGWKWCHPHPPCLTSWVLLSQWWVQMASWCCFWNVNMGRKSVLNNTTLIFFNQAECQPRTFFFTAAYPSYKHNCCFSGAAQSKSAGSGQDEVSGIHQYCANSSCSLGYVHTADGSRTYSIHIYKRKSTRLNLK